jgi:hypothetical protein
MARLRTHRTSEGMPRNQLKAGGNISRNFYNFKCDMMEILFSSFSVVLCVQIKMNFKTNFLLI